MIKRSIVFIVLLLPLLHFGQDFSEFWTGYYSYFDIKDVVTANNKIYAASENAVFSYNSLTKEFTEHTTINGLSGEEISTIHYSNANSLLVVGYNNGLIEIIFDDSDEVLTIVDIESKPTINTTNKKINSITEYEDVVYLSTGFGISVFNLKRLEFGDTYFIGDAGSQIQVNQTTIFNGDIYAACQTGGVRKGSLSNPNLIDFNNWTTIATGSFLGIASLDTNLYAFNSNRVVSSINNDILTAAATLGQVPLDIKIANEELVVTTRDFVSLYNTSFALTTEIPVNAEFNTQYNAATVNPEYIFIATKDFGVLKTSISNPEVLEEIHPDSPLLNRPFAITAGNGDLWLTYGDHSLTLNPFPLKSRGYSRLKNNTWQNIPFSEVLGATNLKEVAINPFNNNQVFIGSYFSGLLEVNNETPTELFTVNNSGLEPVVTTTADTRVSSLKFDNEGVLWSLTNITANPLKSYNPSTNVWDIFSLSDIIEDPFDNNGFTGLEIGADQTKWIGSQNRGLIGLSTENGRQQTKSLSTEEQNMPSRFVTALALDNNQQLWIGTTRGLRVLFNTTNFFNDSNSIAEQIIIEEDGVAQELLFQQLITDIEVDGSNNKWVSTVDAGVFLFSPDGQRTIFHFTKDNSPLPTNNINDMAIDNSNGTVYIASEKGLLAFASGGSSSQENFETARVYPNPVRPGFNIADKKIKIQGITEDTNIKITDIEGNLVAEAQSRTNARFNNFNLEVAGGTAFWNGKNFANNTVASGVYLILLSDLKTFETNVLKLMIVR